MAEEQEVAAIPLIEERVTVARRQVEAGRTRVRISVEERDERVPIELAQEEIEIERVPRGVPLQALPSVRLEGTTTIIPVVEEVVVVEKRLVLVEEIHVRRKIGTETREVPVSLRVEQVAIEQERLGDEAKAPADRENPSPDEAAQPRIVR